MSRIEWEGATTEQDDKYLVAGWDRPLQSFFFQIWNRKDERRMYELEGSENPDQADEYDALIDKYMRFGGEPIIIDEGADGVSQIKDVDELFRRIEKQDFKFLPGGKEQLRKRLLEDKEMDR